MDKFCCLDTHPSTIGRWWTDDRQNSFSWDGRMHVSFFSWPWTSSGLVVALPSQKPKVSKNTEVIVTMRKPVASVALLHYFIAVSFLYGGTTAFSHSQMTMAKARKRASLLSSFYEDGGDSPADEALKARTCFRQFLSQRSLQSFMFLLISCRDPHTANWLKESLNAQNLEVSTQSVSWVASQDVYPILLSMTNILYLLIVNHSTTMGLVLLMWLCSQPGIRCCWKCFPNQKQPLL